MADLRELVILRPGAFDRKPEDRFTRSRANLKMFLRRMVVRSSRMALFRQIYSAVYRTHLWIVVQLSKRIAGTRAVYLSSGLASEDITVGVSDIDIAIFGDWNEARQLQLMKVLAVLASVLPLLDRNAAINIAGVKDLKTLSATNMLIALAHARGKRQWKLLYGDSVLAVLPEIANERFAGCVYMEVRRWWSILCRTALGNGITSRDPVFSNSICFKAAAEILRAEKMLTSSTIDSTRRRDLLADELLQHEDPTVRMLLHSAKKHYLEIEREPHEPTLQWFLARAEHMHDAFAEKPSFSTAASLTVSGNAAERTIAPQTLAHSQKLVELAQQGWPGFRSAALVPCAAMASPDSLALVLEVERGQIPRIRHLRHLRLQHIKAKLPQRLGVYLLLDNAAYQLDAKGALEFLHCTLLPAANPEVFYALSQHGYALYGEPKKLPEPLGWSPFAHELMLEELNLRRRAYARFGLLSQTALIDNVRNLWRFLQLSVMEYSENLGGTVLPITISAIRRELVRWHQSIGADLHSLEQLHLALLLGENPVARNAEAIMKRVFTLFREEADNRRQGD